jgi:hypothetical protein
MICYDLDNQSLICSRDWDFYLCYFIHTGSEPHPMTYSVVIEALLLSRSSQSMKLTTHFHLVLKTWMYGALPLCFLFVLMVWCCGQRAHLKTHMHLVPWCRICGTLPVCRLYVYMVWCVGTGNCTYVLMSSSSTLFNLFKPQPLSPMHPHTHSPVFHASQ